MPSNIAAGQRRKAPNEFSHRLSIAHGSLREVETQLLIAVMPSEVEGRALVYVEAQAGGRLLLASDIPAAREVVEDGRTGLLFRKGDVGDLVAQTLRAAGDPGLRAAIGRRARDSVRAHDLDRTVAGYEHALRELAGRPRQ